MKTEWQFFFETHGFTFEKDHKFKGEIAKKNENTKKFEYRVHIVPDIKKISPTATQTGQFFITIPLRHDEAKEAVYYLAYYLSQKITFEFGEFKLHGGMVACKNIPETPEEEIEVGETPYRVEVRLQEVLDPIKFKPSDFEKISNLPLDIELVSQHNSATNAVNPIDKFLGYFKIIESKFPPKSRKQSLREAFINSNILPKIFINTFQFDKDEDTHQKFIAFTEAIIHARHRCSHLKKDSNFGYLPTDPKIESEVEPYLYPLDILTYEIIKYFAINV